jgi:predicted nuclease of predicted toxin-antitoxin system
MKVKLDENMPTDLAMFLRSAGHDVATALEENLSGADDPELLRRATEEGRLFITFDIDFADIRKYPIGSHRGIVIFRLHDQRWSNMRGPALRLLQPDLFRRLHQGLAIVHETRVRLSLKKDGPK